MVIIQLIVALLVSSILQVQGNVLMPKGCQDLHSLGQNNNGYYIVYDSNRMPFRVYCDFNSEPGFVYTLVLSWKFTNRVMLPFRSQSYTMNHPVNEFNPNWESYRMSKPQMSYIRYLKGTTHWRITCNFDTTPIDYRDYMRASFNNIDVLTYTGADCQKVEYVNIMGSGCQDCKVFLAQQPALVFTLFGYNTHNQCKFSFQDGFNKIQQKIRHVFGNFDIGNSNKQMRCWNSDNATTNLWFGGKQTILNKNRNPITPYKV